MTPNNPSPESITIWFEQLKQGDSEAATKLWDRFFDRLVNVARAQLTNANTRVRDEEDVAAGVLASLCQCANRGKLPSIENRDDLWHLLLKWTRHDVIDHVRTVGRLKRGANQVRGDSVFLRDGDDSLSPGGFDLVESLEPTPAMLVEMEEQFSLLLNKIPDQLLRSIAVKKMEGFTNDEIAAGLELSPRTIERKLNLIRSCWSV